MVGCGEGTNTLSAPVGTPLVPNPIHPWLP
jgi:hypothetical protein